MTPPISYEKANAIMRAALDEETGELIVRIYDLTEVEVDALIEAAQFIDKEACDYAERILEEDVDERTPPVSEGR